MGIISANHLLWIGNKGLRFFCGNGREISSASVFKLDGMSSRRQAFDRLCANISAEYRRRTAIDAHEARCWLRRVCYELTIVVYVDHQESQSDDGPNLFVDRIARRKKGGGRKGTPNIFQTALSAIFAGEQTATLTPNERKRMGMQLWYAFRHFIPSPFLDGCITSAGRARTEVHEQSLVLNPEFHDWIVEKRVKGDPCEDIRGRYPSDIDERVQQTLEEIDSRSERRKQSRSRPAHNDDDDFEY